jgi:hypothetical protein
VRRRRSWRQRTGPDRRTQQPPAHIYPSIVVEALAARPDRDPAIPRRRSRPCWFSGAFELGRAMALPQTDLD